MESHTDGCGPCVRAQRRPPIVGTANIDFVGCGADDLKSVAVGAPLRVQRKACAVNTAQTLADKIIANYDNPLQSSSIDVPAHVESLLQDLGATTSDSGGKVTYYGSDPITPDRLPYGAISAISLAAKAILIAKIWKERTGEGQDIHVDVRKALRRLTPFLDGKWELVNGFPGRTDPFSPFAGGPDIVPTKDGKWVMFAEPYPALRQHALELLKPRGGTYQALADAVKEWNGEELEEAAENAGVPMPLARNIKDVLKMDAFTKNLGPMPLVSVEKVGESDPIPFTPNPTTPLDGIRLLSSSHVIAAPSIGRAMALHGADSLNVWRPTDVEHSLWHYTSHVGVRSTVLELADKAGRAKFGELLSQADVLVTNRRTGWRDRFEITSEEVVKERPGLIDTQITWAGESGQWSSRVGFDITATFALGLDNIEGSDGKPVHPSIFVACDYAAGLAGNVRHPFGTAAACEGRRQLSGPGIAGAHGFMACRVGHLRSRLREQDGRLN